MFIALTPSPTLIYIDSKSKKTKLITLTDSFLFPFPTLNNCFLEKKTDIITIFEQLRKLGKYYEDIEIFSCGLNNSLEFLCNMKFIINYTKIFIILKSDEDLFSVSKCFHNYLDPIKLGKTQLFWKYFEIYKA